MTPRPTLTPRVVRGLHFAIDSLQVRQSMFAGMSAVQADVRSAIDYIRALLHEWDENKAKLAREGTKLPEGDE